MLDLLVKNASLPDGRIHMTVAVRDDLIAEISPGLDAPAREVIDAQGYLLSPPFVDAHFHTDATLSYGLPRVNVACGHDCVMDPWYGMGSGDMLEVAHMGLHVAQMTSQQGIRACFDAVTVNAAKEMHLQGYGLAAGCDASFVLLQARDAVEAIRLRANRLKVWREGALVAETPEVVARLLLPERAPATSFMSSR